MLAQTNIKVITNQCWQCDAGERTANRKPIRRHTPVLPARRPAKAPVVCSKDHLISTALATFSMRRQSDQTNETIQLSYNSFATISQIQNTNNHCTKNVYSHVFRPV